MLTLVWLIALIVLVMALAYHRAPLWLSTLAGAGFLLALGLLTPPRPALLITLWAVFLLIAVPLNAFPLRRLLISNRLLKLFRRLLPPLSATEREALEAGSVWWDAELFSGRPRWKRLLGAPRPALSAEEQAFLDGPVEELCRLLDEWEITQQRRDLSPAAWEFIKRNGFMGMIIPKEYGGLGFSALAHSEVVMKINSRSPSAGATVSVPNSLGPAELLLQFGTDAQRTHYLPRLARGEEIPCFALTGPQAGSDAAGMTDHGIVCRGEFDGREIVGLRLNWDKRYITLGPIASVLGLAFKVYDPDGLLGGDYERGISLALIPTDTPGVEIGRRHWPLDAAFMNGPTRGRDVFIPLDWIIGGEAMIGHGWSMLMSALSAGRAISLPASATGNAKLAAAVSGAYARVRQQFNLPIGEFEGVQEALARIGGHAYAMDAARVITAGAVDLGEKPAVLSAIVKYHLTERGRQVINDAMDVHGGKGICLGPSNYLGRVYQTLPVSITVEGANILTRSMMIFGQGAIRCHPYLLREILAAQEPNQRAAAKAFDRALFGHLGLLLSNSVRALLLGISGGRIARLGGAAETQPHLRQLNRLAAAFALIADAALIYLGSSLKRRERISARLGDALSMLYLGSAIVKHYHDQDCPAEDRPLLDWALLDTLQRLETALLEVLRNLPSRLLAGSLRLLALPLGRRCAAPTDALDTAVARLLLQPGPARERLLAGSYRNREPDDAVGRVEYALEQVIAAEPLEHKLRQAVQEGRLRVAPGSDRIQAALAAGLLETGEAEQLAEAERARAAVIAVDDFARDEMEPAAAALAAG